MGIDQAREYAFDNRIARCDTCPLQMRSGATICLSQKPEEHFNGLMIVGEGPGVTEARLKTPFIGRSGDLLDALLRDAGLERDECYVSNATLCLPEQGKKDEQLASAVYACRQRLLTEIQYLQPRVILALGQAALSSLVGEETVRQKRFPFDCEACQNVRTWKRWGCSKCKVTYPEYPVVDKLQKPSETTPCCVAKWQPRNVKCESCGGMKTRVETSTSFATSHKISFVAGGLFTASDLPIAPFLEHPDKTYLIGTYHPAHLLYAAKKKSDKDIGGQFLAPAALSHVRKAARLLSEDPTWQFDWHEIVDAADFDAYVSAPGRYSVDIETNAKDPFEVTDIRCVAVHHEDARSTAALYLSSFAATTPLVESLCRFLRRPEARKTFQNGASYDAIVLKRLYDVSIEGYDSDTLIAHNTLSADEPHDLSHIVFSYTDAPPWKPPRKGKDGLQFDSKEELLAYCAMDTRGTADAMMHMEACMAFEGATQVHTLDMQKFHLAHEMMMFGMSVDRQEMLQIGAKAQYDMESALHKMREMTGRLPDQLIPKDVQDKDAFFLNPFSTRQLRWALFDPSGLCRFTPTRLTETKEYSTDKGALLPFADHVFVDTLFAFKNAHKIKSVWVDGMPLGPDGRMHGRWNPVGARTGRWTTSPNFQNWPKWIRAMVVALEGRAFVGADYSQLELRIIAALSGDVEMIRRCVTADESRKLEPDHDPHSYVAYTAFGEPFKALQLKDPSHDGDNTRCICQTCTRKHLRDVAKRVVYGLNYGAGAETIREAIYDGGYDGPAISIDTINQVIAAYFKAFPGVPTWRDGVLSECMRTGRIQDALLGRFRDFPLLQIEPTVAYNYPIQSTAATVMDIGALKLRAALPAVDPTAQIFALVHDAAYVECAIDKAPAVARVVEDCLSCEVQLAGAAGGWMPLPAAAQIANNWKDAA